MTPLLHSAGIANQAMQRTAGQSRLQFSMTKPHLLQAKLGLASGG